MKKDKSFDGNLTGIPLEQGKNAVLAWFRTRIAQSAVNDPKTCSHVLPKAAKQLLICVSEVVGGKLARYRLCTLCGKELPIKGGK